MLKSVSLFYLAAYDNIRRESLEKQIVAYNIKYSQMAKQRELEYMWLIYK